MGLITANSISISVRQRQTEIAVLKVLGYRPLLILILLLGEAMLLGALGGLLSAGLVYESVNRLLDNADSIIPLYIPETAFVWGPAVGMVTALAGSLVPVWNGCKIRVSTVFTRVA
jgi:putative ABC transport system permease protein